MPCKKNKLKKIVEGGKQLGHIKFLLDKRQDVLPFREPDACPERNDLPRITQE